MTEPQADQPPDRDNPRTLYHPGTGAEYLTGDPLEYTRLRAHGYRTEPPSPEDEPDVGPQDAHLPTARRRHAEAAPPVEQATS